MFIIINKNGIIIEVIFLNYFVIHLQHPVEILNPTGSMPRTFQSLLTKQNCYREKLIVPVSLYKMQGFEKPTESANRYYEVYRELFLS